MKIKSIFAREVLDSRGNPTVEAEVATSSGGFGKAIAPSGASTGAHEALELRDGGKRYGGKGVLKAVANVNTKIARALKGMDAAKQREIDETMLELDGTENKTNLGANATVAVSMACSRAAANSLGIPLHAHFSKLSGRKGKLLPVPMLNVLNGGKHAGTRLSIQEFMIIPKGAKSFPECLQISAETYHALGSILKKKYGVTAKNVGDEGGYAPPINSTEEALDALVQAIEECGYSKKIFLGIDSASSSFYDEKSGKYKLDGKMASKEHLLEFYVQLASKYPIISYEDPFAEEDFESFAMLVRKVAPKIQVVGDDLVVTNVKRIREAIRRKSMTALLLKVNQIGTITESLAAAKMCFENGMSVVVSHRSGETDDDTIADLAVGIACGQIKTGAPARGERTAKYNRLLRIEGSFARPVFAGRT
ncbi:MAG: phosphopyruvate hydratase [Candidatus Micrarchaeota archaeon]|nr:phosphopyruvate hydratase [Candidatus Micrarchaeota archaeon]